MKLKQFIFALVAMLSFAFSAFAQTVTSAADLKDALSSTGAVVTLGDNITVAEAISIPKGITVTLDLNGKSITGTHSGYVFAVAGTLNINDSNGAGTVTGKSSVLHVQGGGNITLNAGTIYRSSGLVVYTTGRFVVNGGYVKTATTTNTLSASNAGVRVAGSGTIQLNGGKVTSLLVSAGNLNITGSDVEVEGGINVTSAKGVNITAGDINGNVTIADGAKSVVSVSGGNFEDAEAIEEFLPDGSTLLDKGDGTFEVVAGLLQIKETGKYYPTLAAALEAAADGQTVKLLSQEGAAPIAMNGSLYGKNVTITGTATVDWSKGFLFVGRGGEGNATVTFDGANLTSASNSASYGIHVSGREKNTNNKYDGTVVIKNSTIVLDYLINKGAMTLANSTLTVKNGFAVGGRPASETESGEDATATISLTKESKLIVDKHNGMGLGYEAIGVMNIDETSAFECTKDFLVTAKGAMNIEGHAKVAGALTNNGSIVLANNKATLESNECGNVTTTVENKAVVYAKGVYSLAPAVAKIGTAMYTSLQAAIDAAILMTGDVTVEILAGTYAHDINLTNAAVTTGDVNNRPNITLKAVEGNEVVLAGTVTLGYRQQNVGASMWNGKVTFEGITFDHAQDGKHSLDIQDVKGIALINCNLIGDGEYGIGSNGGNATTDAVFTGCTFENGSMQVLGLLGAHLVVDGCECKDFSFNVQGGAAPGMIIKNTTFNMTLTNAHVGESFYVVRTNACPVNIEGTKINVDSKVSSVAANQSKWGLFWARQDSDAKWDIENCEVNLTDAAMAQTELLLTKNATPTYDKAKVRIEITNLTSTSNNVEDLIARAEGCATVNGAKYLDGKLDVTEMAAKIGDVYYATLEEAAAAAQAGDVIIMRLDATLAAELTLPAGITLNGNGKQINGTIYAGGNLTFAGHTKVTAFSAGYYDRVITIGNGACLEITGSGRVTLGYGNTFNITGSVENAKAADKANVQPSLIIPGGMSITGGNDATMNVTNAYVKIGSTTSKNSAANGTFNLNFTNSIVEFTDQFTLAEPTSGKTPTFNVNITNSVLTTGKKFIAAAPNSNVVVDNSNVTLGTYFRNSGKFDIVNGSAFTGSTIQFGENGGNDGALTVDNSTLTITASSEGHALDGKGTGSITLKNNATASVDYVKDMAINVETTGYEGLSVTEPKLVFACKNANAESVTVTDGAKATVDGDGVKVTLIPVAKVGNTEYATIDDAIAAWTNNTTLTLLDNVTLSDVITLKSTEHHTLNLGTYTMTAASGKNAIEITCEGREKASYALTVNADANNPGGITATGMACIYYNKTNTVKDRPIILINNGVFNGSYSINSKSNGNTNCPQIWINGGIFNGNVNLTKNLLQVKGGTFNGWINCTGDQNAYRLIAGGTFKQWQFMTADATNKFAVSSAMSKDSNGNWIGTYNVGVHVDDNGYLVVGGDVVTEPGNFEASSANYGGWSSYLKYSSAKDNGLYYTSVKEALADNNKASGEVTVYADEVDMTGISYKGTIIVPAGESVTITNAPADLKVKTTDGYFLTNKNGTYTSMLAVAKVGDKEFETVQKALQYAIDNSAAEVVVLTDVREKMVTDFDLVIKANLTIKAAEKFTAEAPAKVEFYNEGTSYDFVAGTADGAERCTLTIAENVHFDLVDRVIWLGYYGNNVDVVVNGYLGGYQIWHGANTTVNNGGMLDSHGEAFIMRRDATLTANEGAKVNANYFHIYSGHINATGADIIAGLVWVYNNHDYGREGTVSFDLENTTFTSNGEVKMYPGADKRIPVTVSNDSHFVAKGAMTLDNSVDVTVDATSSITHNNGQAFKLPVATINGLKYTSLQDAVNAVKNGEEIVLVDVVTEKNVTVVQAPDMAFTINGGGNTMKGTITVNGKSAAYATAGLTINNVNFVADGIDAEACINLGVKGDNSTRYTSNVTVDGCTFTGTDKAKAGIKNYTGGCKNVTISNCTATGLHSLAQFKTSTGITLTKNTVTECKNGISVDGSTGVTVTECTVDVAGYGIRANGGSDVTVTSSNVEAFTPVVVRNVTANSNFAFNGANTMTANDETGKWMVIGDEEYEAGKQLPVESTANAVVALNDANLSYTGIHGAGLAGAGTAEKPYLINNVAELVWFRNSVNAGSTKFNDQGVHVALAADIDLTGINWVGIGSMNADHGFMGNFDGKGFKIQNLTIENPALDTDGYAYAGLFALTEGAEDNQNVVKNLTIENVTIKTDGHIVAAAIAYAYYTIVDNVKVCGNIAIEGGDYTAGVLAYTRRCVNASNLAVEGNDGSYIKGAKVVGGVISDIQMNGGLKAVYSNFSAKNVAVSGAQMVGGISGNIAIQTLNGATVENVTLTSGDARVGTVAGCFGGTSTITDVTVNNVTGATAVIGATYNGAKAVEARIGDTYYETFAAAYEAAQAGQTVTMLVDLTIAESLAIDKSIAIDGNYRTLTYTGSGASARAITVENTAQGVELAISNLTVDCTASYCQRGINYNTNGKLTLDNVTVKGTNVTYALNLPGSADGAKVTILNSNLTGNIALNVWGENSTVNVENTTLTAVDNATNEGYAAVKLNNDGATAAEGTVINITGGKIDVTGTACEDTEAVSNATSTGNINISESTVVNGEVTTIVAVIRYNNGYSYSFQTLEAAIAKAEAGETVTLLRDVTVAQPVAINKAITLDGNNKAINYTGANRAIDVANNADADIDVTIKNLTINNTASYTERGINYNENGTLTLENVTVNGEHTTYAINLPGMSQNAKVVIKDSKFTGLIALNIWGANTQVTAENSEFYSVDHSTAEGYAAIKLNNNGSTAANNSTVVINGGKVIAKDNNGAASIAVEDCTSGSTVTISDETEVVGSTTKSVAIISYGSQFYTFSTIEEAIATAKAGETIELISDVTTSAQININKNVAIDGNDKKLTVNAARGFQITGGTVAISNLTIDMPNAAEGNRGINLYNGDTNAALDVTLNNVTINGGKAYAVNIGGGKDNKLTINGSTLTGYAAINVHTSSVNHTIVVDGSTLNGKNHNNNYSFGTVVVDGTNAHSLTITNTNITTENLEGVTSKYDKVVVSANCTLNWDGGEAAVRSILADSKKGKLYYTDLQTAINDAAEVSGTVQILGNITATKSIAIPAAKKVTIDLNGKTITGTDTGTASYGLININPEAELTINDATGEGAIKLTATENRGWNAYSSVISNQRGKLTVNGGTIEHLGGTDMAYAIDILTNTGAQNAEAVINGGAIKSTYRAIRQFLNSAKAKNILTVNGGTIEGGNKSIWMQDANASANPGALTVADDAKLIGDVYLYVTAGSTAWPVEVSIDAAALQGESKVTTGNVPAGYDLALVDGVYGVYSGAAKIGTAYYATIAEAVKAVQEGETITILAGTHTEGSIKLPATLKNVTIEGAEGAVLKDMTITAADGNTVNYEGLTFDGITFENSIVVFTGMRSGLVSYKNIAITNCKFLNIVRTGNYAAFHFNSNAAEAINGFTFTNNVIDGVSGSSNSGINVKYCTGEIKVENNIINNVAFRPYLVQVVTNDGIDDNFVSTGNTFSGSAVGRLQVLGNDAEGTDAVNLVVSNNIFKGITNAQQFCYYSFNPETTTADFSKNYYDIENIIEKADKFYFNAAAADASDLIEMGVYPYYAALNEDGTIDESSLVEAPVAVIGTTGYASLQGAVAAAETGAVVTMVDDAEMTTADLATQNDGYAVLVNVNGKKVTIDLNGKKITVNAAAADLAAAKGKMLLTVFHADTNGELTLTDNTADKAGAVVVNVNDAKVYSMFASESQYSDKSESGKITVNGGNYTTVGKIANAMFFTDANEVITVNGGNFHCDGATTTASNPWMFNTLGNNELHVTVNGGTFNVDVNHQHRPFEVKVPETLAVKANGDGTWTVVEAEAYITEMLGGTVYEAGNYSHKVGYATIAEAIAAVNELGNKVSIAKDLELTEAVVVPADKTVVLDLNGKTVTMNDASGANAVLLKNNGNLTIMDGTEAKAGKLSFKTTTPSAANAYASNTISNYGTLTIESGNVENLSVGGGACYALDNYAGSTATINGGKLTAEKTAVRIFNWTNGEEAKATINMNGGEIYSKNGYGINVNSGNAPFVALNIAGGTITTDYADYKLAVYVVNKNSAENLTINVTDGTFNGIFALNGVTAQTMKQDAVAVSGGTFEGVSCYDDPAYGFVSGGTFKSVVDAKAVATGFICKDNGDGTFGVIVDPKHGMVAQIIRNDYYAENQYFATINEAVQAAVNGETVTLIADVETSAAKLATIGKENYAVLVAVKEKDITLNLNGKSVTVTPTAEELENAEGQMLMSVFGMDTNGKLTLTGNGSVKVNANGANVYSLVAAYGEGSAVVIENGNYEADAVMSSGSLIYSHELITVMDGTFNLGNIATGANGSPWIFNTIGQNYTGVKVVGGTYPTDINHQFWANEVLVPEAYALKNNGDGTWTVVDAVAYTNEKATSRGASWRHVGYASLEDAIAATGKYNCQNNTVTMIKDITLEPITVANGVKVAIDLNGKTISGTDNGTANFGLINNMGDLTINGTGAITLTATQNRGLSAYSSVISNTVGGKLTVNGGTIEHLGGTSMAYAIDNLTNGKGTYAETEINGGVVKSKYIAIRQFLNGVEAENILNVNGGTLEGKYSIFFQDPSKNANSGTLYVDAEATLNASVYLGVTEGSTEWPVEVEVAVAALKGESTVVANNVPANYHVTKYPTAWIVECSKLGELTIDEADYAETGYINLVEKTVETLTYVRNFENDGWQSLYLPFGFTITEEMAAEFEFAYIYNASYKNKETVIDFVKVGAGFELAANYPYMIRAKEAGEKVIVVENAVLEVTKDETIDCSTVFEKFTFAGNYVANFAPEASDKKKYYVMDGGEWNDLDTLNPFRFFLQIEYRNGSAFVDDAQSIRMRSVNAYGEETTGINGVDAEQAGDFIFDLHGRRVLETEKGGIYIKNGKKFIAQ